MFVEYCPNPPRVVKAGSGSSAEQLFGSLDDFIQKTSRVAEAGSVKAMFTNMMGTCRKVFGSLQPVSDYEDPKVSAVVSLLNEFAGSERENQIEGAENKDISVDQLQDPLITRRKGRPKGSTMAKRFRSGGEVPRTKKQRKKVTFQPNPEVLCEKVDQTAVVAETGKSVSGDTATGQKSTETKESEKENASRPKKTSQTTSTVQLVPHLHT